jgi:hypothetical protein
MTDPFEQAAHVEHRRKRRRREQQMRMSLRIHAGVFVFIQLLLVTTWVVTGAGFPWFVFPLLGWGAGLAAHALAVSGSRGALDDDIEADR